MNDDPLWYKDAVFYEAYVRAFYDSSDDGIGDLKGLIAKLDYLEWLGIDCLWLLPILESPLRDGGYDISNYEKILPEYGTVDDFKQLLTEAHRRNIRVIMDMVINHTSDQHEWFQNARQPGSPMRNWYVWSDTPDRYRDARIIFVDTETSNWTWDPVAEAFYWHRFFSHQPDLNYDNPAVQEAILKAMAFWLEMGIDGFRVDAVPYLFEREGTNCENLPETHEFAKCLRRFVDERFPGRLLLAEANQWPEDVREYFGDGDEFQMAFHFPIMPRIFMSLRREDVTPLAEIIEKTPDIPENCQWGIFLRNHDELTLEMVSDEERDYMYHEYATDSRMKCNIGIRRRLAPLLENGRRQMELLNALLFSLPGSPIIYYGDEIGMGDNIYLGDRDGVRTPMQWSIDRNGGFSRADFAKLYFPVNLDPVYGHYAVNVEAQRRQRTSLLHWMRRMIHLRKRYKALGRGSFEILKIGNKAIFAFIRRCEGEIILCLNNLSRYTQPVNIDLSCYDGFTPVEMMGGVVFPRIGALPYQVALGPHGFLWFRLEDAS